MAGGGDPLLELAGLLGFEPRKKVLETSMIPFHHRPMMFILTQFFPEVLCSLNQTVLISFLSF